MAGAGEPLSSRRARPRANIRATTAGSGSPDAAHTLADVTTTTRALAIVNP
jgi:hypothetical protein